MQKKGIMFVYVKLYDLDKHTNWVGIIYSLYGMRI